MDQARTTRPGQTEDWASARRQMGDRLLSVIMPAYNLGSSIRDNVLRVHTLFNGRLPFEIVVVDDGSRDNTRSELAEVADQHAEIHPVHVERNSGKGNALTRGFAASSGQFVLLLDGDLDLPPSQVSRFFEIMEREHADVVIGSKRHPDSVLTYPWHRKVVSNVYYALVKLLAGLPVRDTQTGIKLFKREVLEWVVPRMLVKKFAFDLELLAIANNRGFRIAESPITMRSGARWSWVRPTTVRQIVRDTLAIFYRLRILHYYQNIRETCQPSPPPLISILIAYPAPTRYLEECLSGIAIQTYKQYEVLLLPDEPSGRTWPPGITEVPTGKIRPAEKRNIGIGRAKGSLIAFLDDDTEPAEDWLRQAVVYFWDPEIAAVGGPATTPISDPFMARLGGRVYANRLVSGSYRYRYHADRVRDVTDFPSCNLIVRTTVLKNIGGFRTDFWPGEDTYLCLEIVEKLGQKIVYDPRVHVFHHRRKLFLPHLRQIGRYALHRGYFARRFPATSRKFSYMLPSLLVLGLLVGAALSALSAWIRLVYLSGLAAYGLLTLAASVSKNPATWGLTWVGVILTHLVYGIRFAAGFFTSRLPGEVQRFDHPSEAKETRRGGDPQKDRP